MSGEVGDPSFPRIDVNRKTGSEPFHRAGEPLDFDVLSFWQWSTSDLISNATRGILAEYLVARALGDADGARAEWDAFDTTSRSGVRVEVKSSAYIQSWHQDRPSSITYSIPPTIAWDADTNRFADERKRQADVYVFCLLHHMEQETVDPLDVSQWTFFVILTKQLDVALGDQKTVGLSRLQEIGAEEVNFLELADAVERAGHYEPREHEVEE